MEVAELAKYLRLKESEAKMLKDRADQLGLDPVAGEIHLIKRNKEEKPNVWVEVYSFQIGIEGFRKIADRSGQYDGQEPIIFTVLRDGNVLETPVVLQDDKLVAATARVYRKGISRPFTHTAHLRDYVQLTRTGKITSMWHKDTIMLPKCAEAGCFRKGFPDLALGEVYEPAELPDNDANGNGNGNGCTDADILNGKTKSAPPWSGFDTVPATAASAAPEAVATTEPTVEAPVPETAVAPAAPEAVASGTPVEAPKPSEKMAVPSQKDAIMRLSIIKDTSSLGPVDPETLTFKAASALIKQLNKLSLKKEAAA